MQSFREEDLLIISWEKNLPHDIHGNRYLDGSRPRGPTSMDTGARNWTRLPTAQLSLVAHSTLLGSLIPSHPPGSPPGGNCSAGLSKVFYSDNGSTAVEVALKVAFQFWRNQGQSQKQRFLKLSGGYHGDTLGAVSVGGIPIFHEIYRPLLFDTLEAPAPYCYRCSHRDNCGQQCLTRLEELVAAHHHELAAVILEPVMQGAAGMIPQPPGYLARVRR
jgi:adenosylmethionine-8-amino-7-oxononanoate aminotransferase